MAAWTSDELGKVGAADELRIASVRRDGTLRGPVTIWVVRVGDDLYVRAVNGRDGAWFRGTQQRGEGRVEAGGVGKDVTFSGEPDPGVNERVDAEYRGKYRRYADDVVATVLTPRAREATLRLVPRQPAS